MAHKFFGPAPVLRSEDGKLYEQMREEFLACLQADDILKLTMVEGLVHDAWLMRRYDLHQSLAIERLYHQGLAFQMQRKKVQAMRKEGLAQSLAATAIERPNDVAEVSRLAREMIEGSITDMDDLSLQTPAELDHNRAFERAMVFIEQLERLKVSASKRFEQRLKMLEDYSEGFGQRLRKAAENFLKPTAETGPLELPASEAPATVPTAGEGTAGSHEVTVNNGEAR